MLPVHTLDGDGGVTSVKLLDVNVSELDWVAVMLQRDGAAFGYPRKLGLANYRFSIDDHSDTVVNESNFKAVPLAG